MLGRGPGYHTKDPFFRFWFRYVADNGSRLEPHRTTGRFPPSPHFTASVACSSRYALATVTGSNGRFAFGPASRLAFRQRRIVTATFRCLATRHPCVLNPHP